MNTMRPSLSMEANSINKILVAIDFADEAEDILKIAGELGSSLSAEIHLVHVYRPDPDPVYDSIIFPVLVAGETEAEHEKVLQEERSQLRGQADRLRKAGAKTFGYMKPMEKGIAKSILNFVDEIHADLIVIGTRHPNRIDEFLVGSVAKKVLKKSQTPVLLVPRSSIGIGV